MEGLGGTGRKMLKTSMVSSVHNVNTVRKKTFGCQAALNFTNVETTASLISYPRSLLTFGEEFLLILLRLHVRKRFRHTILKAFHSCNCYRKMFLERSVDASIKQLNVFVFGWFWPKHSLTILTLLVCFV